MDYVRDPISDTEPVSETETQVEKPREHVFRLRAEIMPVDEDSFLDGATLKKANAKSGRIARFLRLNGHDREDIVQELLLGVRENEDKADSNRGSNSQFVSGIINGSAKNLWRKCLKQVRIAESSSRPEDLHTVDPLTGRRRKIEETLAMKRDWRRDFEFKDSWDYLLGQLSDKEKLALDLMVDGLTQEEIADALRMTRSTYRRNVEARVLGKIVAIFKGW